MTLQTILRPQLETFDGRSTDVLAGIVAGHGADPGYVAAIIALAGDHAPDVRDGATWLIKAWLEAGGALEPAEITALFGTRDDTDGWAASLHLCQSVRHLALDRSQAASIAAWLGPLLTHRRPFLRAWSLDALCAVAGQWPDFAPDAAAALDRADNDTAASVRARARNLKKR